MSPAAALMGLHAVLVGVIAVAACAACAAKLPPDPDRAPGLARELRLDSERRDFLHCARNDCSDWFRVYAPGPGRLELVVERADLSTQSTVELVLGDDRADRIEAVRLTDRGQLRVQVAAGYYFVLVRTAAPERLAYVLRVTFQARRAPPRTRRSNKDKERPPRIRVVEGQLVEAESRDGAVAAVLFRVASPELLRIGSRGRLLRGDEVVGEFEVTEIFAGGGVRAQVLGSVGSRIDAGTRVVVDVVAPSQ